MYNRKIQICNTNYMYIKRQTTDVFFKFRGIKSWSSSFKISYVVLYNNQINARALIGLSDIVYCASKPVENSGVFRIIIEKQ